MKSVVNYLRRFRLISLLVFVSVISLSSCIGGTQDAVATGVAQTMQISELETRAAPIPTNEESSVCQLSDANNKVHINDAEGFCFQYPNNHTEVIDSASAVEISGPPPPANTDAFTTALTIEIENAQGMSTSQFAETKIDMLTDSILSEGFGDFDLDGEGALWVTEIFIGLGPPDARHAYAVHNGIGYILSLTPDGGNDYDVAIEASNLWNTITDTWVWFTP